MVAKCEIYLVVRKT